MGAFQHEGRTTYSSVCVSIFTALTPELFDLTWFTVRLFYLRIKWHSMMRTCDVHQISHLTWPGSFWVLEGSVSWLSLPWAECVAPCGVSLCWTWCQLGLLLIPYKHQWYNCLTSLGRLAKMGKHRNHTTLIKLSCPRGVGLLSRFTQGGARQPFCPIEPCFVVRNPFWNGIFQKSLFSL